MAQWVAICPKCEKFYILNKYRPDFFCAHPLPINFNLKNNTYEAIGPVISTRISCKVLFLEKK